MFFISVCICARDPKLPRRNLVRSVASLRLDAIDSATLPSDRFACGVMLRASKFMRFYVLYFPQNFIKPHFTSFSPQFPSGRGVGSIG